MICGPVKGPLLAHGGTLVLQWNNSRPRLGRLQNGTNPGSVARNSSGHGSPMAFGFPNWANSWNALSIRGRAGLGSRCFVSVSLQVAVQAGASNAKDLRSPQPVSLTHFQDALHVYFSDFFQRQRFPLFALRARTATLENAPASPPGRRSRPW